jgi:hypothetical protein
MLPATLTPAVQRLSVRGYHALLALYPAIFRAEYGAEMAELFEQRWLDTYAARGFTGVARWLWLTAADALSSAFREHGVTMTETIEASPQARGELVLGALFLVGTWAALLGSVSVLFAPSARAAGLFAGSAVVLLNALLVARALTRSTQSAPLAGMAAFANVLLIAALLALLGTAARLGLPASSAALAGTLLIALQTAWLWRLRGDDFIEPVFANAVGE